MLLKGYSFETEMPKCNFFAQTVNAIAQLSDDISDALPYLAAIIKVCKYDDASKILTFKKEGRSIIISSRQIAVSKLVDRDEARSVLDEIKEFINSTYDNRQKIEPCFKKGSELKNLEVLKLLPRTNCKECGQPTCVAFVSKLVKWEATIIECLPLFRSQFDDEKRKLLKMLAVAGYDVPDDNSTPDQMLDF